MKFLPRWFFWSCQKAGGSQRHISIGFERETWSVVNEMPLI
jgi:hypothetical protein